MAYPLESLLRAKKYFTRHITVLGQAAENLQFQVFILRICFNAINEKFLLGLRLKFILPFLLPLRFFFPDTCSTELNLDRHKNQAEIVYKSKYICYNCIVVC